MHPATLGERRRRRSIKGVSPTDLSGLHSWKFKQGFLYCFSLPGQWGRIKSDSKEKINISLHI
jgi:hypothetical protein